MGGAAGNAVNEISRSRRSCDVVHGTRTSCVDPRRACAPLAILGLSVYDYSRTTGYEAAYER